MHPAFRAGFEKLADNDPTADPVTHVLAPVGMMLAGRTVGRTFGHMLESPEAGRFIGRATGQVVRTKLSPHEDLALKQQKQLEDDSPEPLAPLKTHEGVF